MFRSGLLRVQCQVSFYLLIALWSRLRAPTDCLNRWLKVRYRIRKSFFCTALLSVLLLQHSVGQIIRPLASVCVSVIAVAITESNLTKLCTVVWGRKIKIKFVRGSKSDNALPVFYPNFHQSNAFQWDGPNTAVLSPLIDCGGSHDAPRRPLGVRHWKMA